MRAKLISWFTSRAGPFVTAGISALIGAGVSAIFIWIGVMSERLPWLDKMIREFWSQLTPEQQQALSPLAIGSAAGVIVWGIIQEWLNKTYARRAEELQQKVNENLPEAKRIVVDRAPLDETMAALDEVLQKRARRE